MRLDPRSGAGRRHAARAVVLVLTAGASAAPAPPAAPPEAARPVAAPRNDSLERLKRPITVEFEEARLEDVLRFLSEATGVSIEPQWSDGRGGAGLHPDALVTAGATAQPALDLLERTLDRTSDAFDASTWQLARDGRLQVGPRSRLNRFRRTETYDVHDLLFNVPSFDQRIEIDLEAVLTQAEGGQRSILREESRTAPGEPIRTAAGRAADMVELLTGQIEPEQWVTNGGDAAAVHHRDGVLIVHAPDYIHRQIGGN